MKQLLLILAFLMGYCIAAHAETIKLVPSSNDSTQMDTVVVSSLQDAEDDVTEAYTTHISTPFGDEFLDSSVTTIALVSIIICCGLPLFIVAIVLWFRYKNKQAKYKLAAEALAAGQTIPKELFNEPEEQNRNILHKGIKNIFLGIGLGVFIWIWTEEEGLAAIGFLIFCMGLGQILIAYTTSSRIKKEGHFDSRLNMDEDKTDGENQLKPNDRETQHNDE